MRPRFRPPRAPLLLLSLLLSVLSPGGAAGQGCPSPTNPACDATPPTIAISPASGTVADSLLAVSIEWSDEEALASSSMGIRLNGVDVASSFTHAGLGGVSIQSTGTVRLAPGPNVLAVWILDAAGNRADASAAYTYSTAPPPPPPAPPAYGVEVSTDAGATVAVAGGKRTHVFRVRNTGNRTATFRVDAPTCPQAAVSQCDPSATLLTLGAGAAGAVGVTFLAGAAGQTGSITLRARQVEPDTAGIEAQAQASIPIAAAAPDTLTLDEVGTEPVVERGMCLTLAAGPGAAWECGDLRLAHALPGTVALNQARAPVLLYSSQHAHPFPSVAARVTLPATGTVSEVVMTVTLAGESAPRVTRTFSVAGWPGGAARRLSVSFDALAGAGLPTGVHDYTATVVASTAGGPMTLLSRAGKLPVVNRAASAVGAGWWVGGVEQLIARPDSSRVWVGGDGSVRLYAPVPGQPNRWAATPVDRPDTLYRDTAGYFRLLPGRAQVRFNAAGQHVATLNALGHRTTFAYDAGRLSTITLPQGTGGGVARQYVFGYGGGTLLQSVTAPGGRVVTLRRGGDTLVIGGPDTTEVRFVTDATVAHRIARRIDRMRRVTQYAFGAAGRMTSVRRFGGSDGRTSDTTDLVVGFTTDLWSTAPHSAAPFVLLDGPRPNADAEDKHLFWLNRWGAPQRIRDSWQVRTGGVKDTWIHREDARWPGLPTRTVAPNGREVTVSYDARGNVVASTDWSTRAADGRYATTLYTWDARWDAPTSTTSPEGRISSTAYDTLTGHTLWQQVGPDSARRVSFAYRPASDPHAPGLARSVAAPLTQAEFFDYDERGNLSAVTDAAGGQTRYSRDAIGRDTLVQSPVSGSLAAETRTAYDAAGRVTDTRQVGPPVSYTRRYPQYDTYVPPSSPREEVRVHTEYDAEGRTVAVSRWAVPDTAKVGTVTTRWRYDVFGRRTHEIAPDSAEDVTRYDRAGNAVEVTTRRGHVIRMAYDDLNRLARRIVPEAQYAGETQQVIDPATTSHYDTARAAWRFPLRAPDTEGNLTVANTGPGTPGGVRVPADTSVFVYDEVGQMTRAANRDAIVTREYNLNGTLRSETQRIRPYAGRDTARHVYTLAYGYDLEGRRAELRHPDGVAPLPNTFTFYRYDARTGALASLENGGNLFRFGYDAAGRPDSTVLPAGVRERLRYDAAGRLVREERWRGAQLIQRDTFTHDLRGKVLSAGTLTDTVANAYSGLGSLVRSYTDVGTLADNDPEETYTTDALGNTVGSSRVWKVRNQDASSITPETTVQHYRPGTGRLLWTEYKQGSDGGRIDAVGFDRAGNRDTTSSARFEGGYTGLYWNGGRQDQALLVDRTRMYYGADQKLRVVDRRSCAFARDVRENIGASTAMLRCYEPFYGSRPALEEHRYDALGRRVLTRTDQGWACGINCVNGVTRTIWDGDQILYEVRAAAKMADDTVSVIDAAVAERDTVGTLEVRDRTQYGRVGYVHGPGIDRPLAVIRMDFHPELPLDETILPHLSWRGSYETGTFVSTGQAHGRCLSEPVGAPEDWGGVYVPGPTEEEYRMDADSTAFCVEVSWPAQTRWMTHLERPLERGYSGPRNWMGSLIEEGRDVSGQMYMRNRYYDPTTGKFTQEDPIGLAGGLNAYGFADGDPVSYSDPYGLCPFWVALLGIGTCQFWDRYHEDGVPGVVDEAASAAPGIGDVHDAIIAVTGRNLATGRTVGNLDRTFSAAGVILPLGGAQFRAVARQIGEGHAFTKHVLDKGEFRGLGIRTYEQFSGLIESIMNAAAGANVKQLSRGRTAYWDDLTGTVVIHDPRSRDLGTAFRPVRGKTYFDNLK